MQLYFTDPSDRRKGNNPNLFFSLRQSPFRIEAGITLARNGGSGRALGLEILANSLDDLPPLDTVLLEPLGAALFHPLGDGGESRERLASNAGLLPKGGPLLRPLGVGPVDGPFLHLEQAAEAGVARHDIHGPLARVDRRGLDAVAYHGFLANDPADEEGKWRRSDGDGADGVEAARCRIETAVEGVDVEDMGEDGGIFRIRKFTPHRRRHAIPRVVVHVLLDVREHHLARDGRSRR